METQHCAIDHPILRIGPNDNIACLVAAGFKAPVAHGMEPFTTSVRFRQELSIEALFPAPYRLLRCHREENDVSYHIGLGGASAYVYSSPWLTEVELSATDPERLSQLRQEVQDRAQALIAPVEGCWLDVCLWNWDRTEGARRHRQMRTSRWAESRGNYPSRVTAQLDSLAELAQPGESGRLVLWHGPPGTGKTSAVLALLKEWEGWCEAHVITDPERMFQEPGYLLKVAMWPTRDKAWKLIVAEDADEYLRSDARRRSGPALGRLLNLTDGILGRGLNTIVLLTTNDEVGSLHPAITRPGRCLSVVDFERFPAPEAARWLGPGAPVGTQPMTLAELYARREGWGNQTAQVRPGVYL